MITAPEPLSTAAISDTSGQKHDSRNVLFPKRKMRFMMLLRRGHLYLGLFLFPWKKLETILRNKLNLNWKDQ